MPGPEERTATAVFRDTLVRQGLRAALGYLNGRTRHRFTGIYRFDEPMLRSVCLFDRENPGLAVAGDMPMAATYCALVDRDRAPFATEDGGSDLRLRGHPARTTVLAYGGVPLFGTDGRCVGSLCHFDARPRLASPAEVLLLERVAPLVVEAAGLSTGTPVASASPSGRDTQTWANVSLRLSADGR